MRLVIQRCSRVKLTANDELRCNAEGPGLLVLVAWEAFELSHSDDSESLVRKILNLRIFPDDEGKMNRSVVDVLGYVVVVSNFTLYASIWKGNRPSYMRAAAAEWAASQFEKLVENIRSLHSPVYAGIFGSAMKIDFTNDGPVTLILDTRQKEF